MSFLGRIAAAVTTDVERPEYDRDVPPRPRRPGRPVRSALLDDRGAGALWVEYKRASPGRPGPRWPSRTVEDLVRATDLPEVVGYSCLATRAEFDGAPSDVAQLAAATDRPVLFKDFVLTERQLEVARRCGASSVLLIARLAPYLHEGATLAGLAARAHELGLEVVFEMHSEEELSLADRLGADVYGVNVRDLDLLRIDRATAERTIDRAREVGLRPIVGFSGVETPADAARFWDHGVDAILVGRAVARATDPRAFLRSLRRDGAERLP